MTVSLFVGNLPYSYDDAKLRELFSVAGTVISSKIISDKYSGRSRGFGFIEMSTEEEMKKAIELYNGKVIDGRPLVVNESHPRG